MSQHEDSSSDSELNNNKQERSQRCWIKCRSDVAVVAVITATITFETALHSALIPILPEHLYESSVRGSSNRMNTTRQHINQSSNFSISDEIKCDEADESEFTIAEENSQVTILFTLKTLLQLVVSLLLGPIINKFGCSIPMAVGYILMIAASLTLAFGNTYVVLLTGALLQGVDAACLMTAGMCLIAERFPDHKRRSTMIGIALTGQGVGSLLGLPFGSIMHQAHGKTLPFLILSGLSAACAVWFMVTVGFQKREVRNTNEPSPSRRELLQDPYIILASLGVVFCSIALPVLEATLPLWMMRTLCFEEWRLGVAFVPGCLLFILSAILFGRFSGYVDGMIWCVLSCFITASACFLIPYSVDYLELPMGLIGISNGMLDAGAFSAIADLIQKRFPNNCYGGGYALLEAAYCLSAVLGPFLAWLLIPVIGFGGCMYLTVGITVLGGIPISIVCCKSSIRSQNKRKNGEKFRLIKRDGIPYERHGFDSINHFRLYQN